MSIHDLSVLGNALLFAVVVTIGGLLARGLMRAVWLRPSHRRTIRVSLSAAAIFAVVVAGSAMWPAALDDDAPAAQVLDETGSPSTDESPRPVAFPVPSSRDEGGAVRSHDPSSAADTHLGASIAGGIDGTDTLDTGPSTDPGAGPGSEPPGPPEVSPVNPPNPPEGPTGPAPGSSNDPPEPPSEPPVSGDPPGQDGDPPGQDGDPPGQDGDPPGQDGDPPGQDGDSPGAPGLANSAGSAG